MYLLSQHLQKIKQDPFDILFLLLAIKEYINCSTGRVPLQR